MPLWLCQFCERLTNCWLTATPGDYFRLSSLVIILGWFLARPTR